MRAKEVVGKARPRLGTLGMHRGLRAPQGCFAPQQGWSMTTLPPPSALGGASRSPLPPPARCRASGLEGRGGSGEPGRGAGDAAEGAGGPPPGGLCSSSPRPRLSRCGGAQTHA